METALSGMDGLRNILGIAVLVILLAWETAKPFFPFFKGRPSERGTHFFRYIAMALLNAALVGFCFASLWAMASAWSISTEF